MPNLDITIPSESIIPLLLMIAFGVLWIFASIQAKLAAKANEDGLKANAALVHDNKRLAKEAEEARARYVSTMSVKRLTPDQIAANVAEYERYMAQHHPNLKP